MCDKNTPTQCEAAGPTPRALALERTHCRQDLCSDSMPREGTHRRGPRRQQQQVDHGLALQLRVSRLQAVQAEQRFIQPAGLAPQLLGLRRSERSWRIAVVLAGAAGEVSTPRRCAGARCQAEQGCVTRLPTRTRLFDRHGACHAQRRFLLRQRLGSGAQRPGRPPRARHQLCCLGCMSARCAPHAPANSAKQKESRKQCPLARPAWKRAWWSDGAGQGVRACQSWWRGWHPGCLASQILLHFAEVPDQMQQ